MIATNFPVFADATAKQWLASAVANRTGPSDRKAPSSDVRHYTGLSYKFNDSGWFDDKKSHLYVIDGTSGKATQITSGDAWNDSDADWSPDGTKITFVSNRTGHESDGNDMVARLDELLYLTLDVRQRGFEYRAARELAVGMGHTCELVVDRASVDVVAALNL